MRNLDKAHMSFGLFFFLDRRNILKPLVEHSRRSSVNLGEPWVSCNILEPCSPLFPGFFVYPFLSV